MRSVSPADVNRRSYSSSILKMSGDKSMPLQLAEVSEQKVKTQFQLPPRPSIKIKKKRRKASQKRCIINENNQRISTENPLSRRSLETIVKRKKSKNRKIQKVKALAEFVKRMEADVQHRDIRAKEYSHPKYFQKLFNKQSLTKANGVRPNSTKHQTMNKHSTFESILHGDEITVLKTFRA